MSIGIFADKKSLIEEAIDVYKHECNSNFIFRFSITRKKDNLVTKTQILS
jgi:hypothetical protein